MEDKPTVQVTCAALEGTTLQRVYLVLNERYEGGTQAAFIDSSWRCWATSVRMLWRPCPT